MSQRRRKPTKRKIQASAQPANPTRDTKNIKDENAEWVNFFKDSSNVYVNDLALRARRSPTHGAIIRSKTIYTCGEGFLFFNDGEPVEVDETLKKALQANKEESLKDLYFNVAYNYILTGNAYVEVQKIGDSYFYFWHDSTKVRVSKDRKKAFISSFWRDIKANSSWDKKKYPVEEVEMWNGRIDTKQKKFIIHIKQNAPEFDYYGIPEHVQVLKWADIEYKIPTYNLARFDNGFFPSALISLIGETPDGDNPQTYVQRVVDSFAGEGNNGKIFAQLVDTPEQAAQVETFSGAESGEFIDLDRLAAQRIISGHRWFASLSGIMVGGQLGSNQQIINEWKIAMNNLVIPEYQAPILKLFEKLLMFRGIELEMRIKSKPPVGVEDRLDPKLVLDMNEQREELGRGPRQELNDIFIDGSDNEDNNSN